MITTTVKTIRIGLLTALIIMSVYTIFFIALPLLFSSFFAPILILVLGALIFFVLREIYRILTWKGY